MDKYEFFVLFVVVMFVFVFAFVLHTGAVNVQVYLYVYVCMCRCCVCVGDVLCLLITIVLIAQDGKVFVWSKNHDSGNWIHQELPQEGNVRLTFFLV